MLFTPDGKEIKRVPHTADFKEVVQLLGDRRTAAVRHVHDRALRIFELFVWECIMAREER